MGSLGACGGATCVAVDEEGGLLRGAGFLTTKGSGFLVAKGAEVWCGFTAMDDVALLLVVATPGVGFLILSPAEDCGGVTAIEGGGILLGAFASGGFVILPWLGICTCIAAFKLLVEAMPTGGFRMLKAKLLSNRFMVIMIVM